MFCWSLQLLNEKPSDLRPRSCQNVHDCELKVVAQVRNFEQIFENSLKNDAELFDHLRSVTNENFNLMKIVRIIQEFFCLLKIKSIFGIKNNFFIFFLRKLKMLRCALFENSRKLLFFSKLTSRWKWRRWMLAGVYDLGRSFFSLYKAKSETLATLTTWIVIERNLR